MAAITTSYDVKSGDESVLQVAITTTQTSGIIISPMNINGNMNTAWATTGGGVIQVEQVIDGTRKVEWIAYGGGSLDSDNAFTLSDVSRDVPRDGSSLTGTGTGQRFSKGATVKLVTFHFLLNKKGNLDRSNTWTGANTFSGAVTHNAAVSSTLSLKVPVYADATARDAAIPSPANGMEVYLTSEGQFYDYVSGAWAARSSGTNPNASTTVAGKVELATAAERAAGTGTGGTGALLVPTNDALVKTSSGAGDENKIPVLNASGKLAAGFVDYTQVNSVPTGTVFLWLTSSAPTGYLLLDGTLVSRSTYSALFSLLSTNYGVGDGSTTFGLPDMRGRHAIGAGTGSKVWTIASMDESTDQVTVPSNLSLYTGQAVVYTAASPATGLTSTSTYYIIRVSATVVQLATSLANAIAGSAINFTTNGSGTQTLTQTLTARSLGDIGGEEAHASSKAEIPSHTHPVATQDDQSPGGTGILFLSSGTGSGATGSSTGGDTAHNNMEPFFVMNYIIKT